ncbi:MAG: hypothetical protein V4538_16355 [Bacteroidota bacterium]
MDKSFCSKTYFATEKDADFYLTKLKATSNRGNIPKRSYLCTHCFSWHLTSTDDDITVMEKYRQKINDLQKLLAEKNQIIHTLRNRNTLIIPSSAQIDKFKKKYKR